MEHNKKNELTTKAIKGQNVLVHLLIAKQPESRIYIKP